MGAGYRSGRAWLFGSVLAVALPALAPPSLASTEAHAKPTHQVAQATHQARETRHVVSHTTHASVRLATARGYAGRSRMRFGGLSCVPYARNASGITVAGNAWQWWDNAAGTYARGNVPEPGGVLDFRSTGRMRLGHVAVVTRVINSRVIEVDHANWAGRGVARGVPVLDVSENNDWTAVRVGLGSGESFGNGIYPTYGFIYDRPDTAPMVTAISAPTAQRAFNRSGSDLRPVSERTTAAALRITPNYDEVAEAPSQSRPSQGGSLTRDRADQ